MAKSRVWHCDKRQGKPRAPASMAQLAREGRLRPEAAGVKHVVLRTKRNKTVSKTVGWLKYTF